MRAHLLPRHHPSESVGKTELVRIRVMFGIVLALTVIGGCAILPGSWRTGWNEPWLDGKERPDTAGSWKLTKLEREDQRFIALAISGGGSRAANFGAAVMLELQQRKLLEQVDLISGVSGGTLPTVYYGLGEKAGAFTDAAVREAMGYNFQASWIRRWFLPQNIFRYWLSDFTRSNIMVQVFDNQLFHEATYADLRLHPKILLNTTVHNDNIRFTYTDEDFSQLHSVLALYPVANAVNASSAFPGAFQDVSLRNYVTPPRYVHLYDGGPIDNLGVQAVIGYMNRNLLGTSLRQLFPKGCVVFVIDATPASDHPELNHGPSSRSFVDYFVDTNALDAMDAMLMESRRSLLSAMGIPVADQDQVLKGRLVVSDKEQCGCEVRHVSLRQLLYLDEDEEGSVARLGKRVTQIKTKFWVSKEEQTDLFDAAKVLTKSLDDQKLLTEESFGVQCANAQRG